MRRSLTLVDGESLNEYFAKLTKINDIVKCGQIQLALLLFRFQNICGSVPFLKRYERRTGGLFVLFSAGAENVGKCVVGNGGTGKEEIVFCLWII